MDVEPVGDLWEARLRDWGIDNTADGFSVGYEHGLVRVRECGYVTYLGFGWHPQDVLPCGIRGGVWGRTPAWRDHLRHAEGWS